MIHIPDSNCKSHAARIQRIMCGSTGIFSWRNKKAHHRMDDGLKKYPGDVLLSHDLSVIVSSALEDFTSVFGMGTGVTPPV